MANSAGPVEWHYIGRFGQLGPLSLDQMLGLCRDGVVGPDSYVWKVGMANWVRLSTVPELVAALPVQNLPPTPPAHAPLEPPIPPLPPSAPDPMRSLFRGHWDSMPAPYYMSDKSRIAAGVLNILLPGVGRLYLGFISTGLLQLVTGWLCGVGFLWSIVDGILILTTRNQLDADGKTLRP